jgi:hypothetical protein
MTATSRRPLLPATARRGCAAGQRRHHDGDANEDSNSVGSFGHCAVDRIRSLWLTLVRFSEEVRHRVWEQLIERPGGPMTFRFILRPAMAAIAALRDGVNDAKSRRSPYFWALLANPFERGYEGLISTPRVILLGLCMDAHLSVDRAQDILSRRGGDRCSRARLFPVPAAARPIARIARWRIDAASRESR